MAADTERSADAASLPPDHVFDLLADYRRRLALACLLDHEPAVSLPDLAEEVAVREFGRPVTDLSGETVLEVYFSLYHAHVPMLVEADVVTYDQERDLVTVARNVDRFRALPSAVLATG